MVDYKALTATDFMEGRYLGTIEVDAALALVRVTAQRASETEAVGSDVCRPRSPRTSRGTLVAGTSPATATALQRRHA